jgi:uncharacterized repeat protein (TIGR01451 family)
MTDSDPDITVKRCKVDGNFIADRFLSAGSGGSTIDGAVVLDSCTIHEFLYNALYTGSDGGITVTNNVFYSCDKTAGLNSGVINIYGADNDILIANNIIHDCGIAGETNYGGAIYLRYPDATNRVRVIGNLIYNCTYGINYYPFSEPGEGNYIAFNTVANCTYSGIRMYTDATTNPDTVMNNISWSNGDQVTYFDLHRLGGDLPVINYNFADEGGRNPTWPAEAVADSGLPGFADYFNNDYQLRVHSPCIDRGDSTLTDYDGSRADMGCYGGSLPLDTLKPHWPDTLIVQGDKENGYQNDSLYWGSYTLADFGFYAVYRDTFAGFVPSEANCIDSVYTQALTGASYPNNGEIFVYKVSAVDDTAYGSGYRAATYARIYVAKISDRINTVPGDTVSYTIFYDNDGGEVSVDTFEIIDLLPPRAEYVDTSGVALHTSGGVDVDWYNGTSWLENEPASLSDVVAIRWQISPGIGEHEGSGDVAGADLNKSGVDTTQGDDSGIVRFVVLIK